MSVIISILFPFRPTGSFSSTVYMTNLWFFIGFYLYFVKETETINEKKVALISGITGQDGAYLAELLLKKNYIVHGIKEEHPQLIPKE